MPLIVTTNFQVNLISVCTFKYERIVQTRYCNSRPLTPEFSRFYIVVLCRTTKKCTRIYNARVPRAKQIVLLSSTWFHLPFYSAQVIYLLGPFRTAAEKFEHAALFLRLGLPSTLIRHENGAFRKRSSKRRNLKKSAFHFRVDGKHFENGAFRKRWRHDNHVISLPEFSSNTNPN